MDFSGFLVIPVAALIAVFTVIATTVVPRWRVRRWFPIAVCLSILIGAIMMQPWQALTMHEWAVLPVGFSLIVIWAVIGSLIGGTAALLVVKAVKLARRGI